MISSENAVLREQLVNLLEGGQASVTAEMVLQGISVTLAGKQLEKLPYTIWQLMEHIRIAAWDIFEFSINSSYRAPQWPEGYWTAETAPQDLDAVKNCSKSILTCTSEMITLLKRQDTDLFKPFAHGDGQHLLREIMLLASHNAYHFGQIVLIRRLLGDW